jgi:CspA family cold shock protein
LQGPGFPLQTNVGGSSNGFIEQPDGEDVFVHFSAITMEGFKTLAEGEEVEFEVKQTDKGLQAASVSRVQ